MIIVIEKKASFVTDMLQGDYNLKFDFLLYLPKILDRDEKILKRKVFVIILALKTFHFVQPPKLLLQN